jgi:hypothetical protein
MAYAILGLIWLGYFGKCHVLRYLGYFGKCNGLGYLGYFGKCHGLGYLGYFETNSVVKYGTNRILMIFWD